MQQTTEEKIMSYVPKRLQKLYPDIVTSYMNEVHEEFDKIMSAYSFHKMFKPNSDDFVPQNEPFQFKQLGKTENYPTFLKNRTKIEKSLLIPYPFIRCIIHYSYSDFPELMNEYSKYRAQGTELTLNEFRDISKKDLTQIASFISKDWYPKVIKVIQKHYKKKTLPKNAWPRIISCATAIINRQINDLKIRTINHLMDTILNSKKIPYMKLITICDYGIIDLFPNLNDIFSVFHHIIDDIIAVATRMESLESAIDDEAFKVKSMYLKIGIADIYIKEAHQECQKVLETAFAPIANYLQTFKDEFQGLIDPNTEKELDIFLATEKTFDEYLEKICDFKVRFLIFKIKIKNLVKQLQ